MAAIFHEQSSPLQVVRFTGSCGHGSDFVIQGGGYLPAHKTGRTGQRPQPVSKARLQRLYTRVSGVEHDVERLDDEGTGGRIFGLGITRHYFTSNGVSTKTNPSS